jgi:ectoine hydroxylase-related dioxygenase (phytanoyl-CoA dioxygenase family)
MHLLDEAAMVHPEILIAAAPMKMRAAPEISGPQQFFKERGWIRVDNVLSREEAADYCAELLRLADNKAGTVDKHVTYLASDDYQRLAQAVNEPSRVSEMFLRLATSKRIGDIIREVTGLPAIRLFRDLGLIKHPETARGIATGVHQDLPFYPMDRRGGAAIWIAFTDLPAHSGTLRFIEGSHKWGPAGRYVLPGKDWLAAHPDDAELLSEAPTLSAGSATIHDALTLHGTDPNCWDRPRIGYTAAYMPADARFNGMPTRWTEGLGLAVDGPFDHPLFPIVA